MSYSTFPSEPCVYTWERSPIAPLANKPVVNIWQDYIERLQARTHFEGKTDPNEPPGPLSLYRDQGIEAGPILLAREKRWLAKQAKQAAAGKLIADKLVPHVRYRLQEIQQQIDADMQKWSPPTCGWCADKQCCECD